jgi:putative transposase
MDKHHPTRLVTRALDAALASRGDPEGVVFHSDNGSQSSPRCAGEAPTSKELTEHCDKNTVVRSRGKVACCWDNAVAESLFATLKKELVHTRPWPTRKDLTDADAVAVAVAVADWIDNYYNTQRRHSTLNYLTPPEHALGYREGYSGWFGCSGWACRRG